MLKFAVRRIAGLIPRLIGVILIVSLLSELMPGDPATIMAGDNATPEAIAAIRSQLHLDQPFFERFGSYLWHVVRGDLGRAPNSSIPVWDRITAALPVTVSLLLVTMVMAVSMGVVAGACAALRKGRLLDRAVSIATSVLLAVPTFVIALLFVIQFTVERTAFPSGGYAPLSSGLWAWLQHLILPSLALALVGASELARQTRGAVVDALSQDFVRAGRAKGLPEWRVLGKHVAKNAATPAITVGGLQVVRVLGGSIVVERIFAMNGFGSLAVDAVLKRDVILLQGIVLVAAVIVLFTNLVVDLSYGYLNPRARTT